MSRGDMLNAATRSFGTNMYCDKPMENSHQATNILLSSGVSHSSKGFICAPLTKTPVNVLFSLPRPVDLRYVFIKPFVGRHRVTQFSVYFREGNPLNLQPAEFVKDTLKSKSSVFIDLYEKHPSTLTVISHLLNDDFVPDSPLLTAPYLHVYRHPFRRQIQYVLINIRRLANPLQLPCLGTVELWCLRPNQVPKAESPQITSPAQEVIPNLPACDTDANSDQHVPDTFLDSLTGQLMTDPIRLPCGNYIDHTSLTRFWQERQVSSSDHSLLDPFTMVPFEENQLTYDNDLRVAIREYTERRDRLNQLCDQLDRGKEIPVACNLPIARQLSTSSQSEDES